MEFLNNGPIELNSLNEIYRKDLETIFNRCSKPAMVIWDYKTRMLVYSIYSRESLQKQNIMNILIDDVDSFNNNKYKSVTFFVQSSLKMIELCENVINRKVCSEYHLVFVPNRLACHMEYIEKRKLNVKFSSIESFKCYGLPVECDVITLGNPDYLVDMTELNTLYHLAKTIVILQTLYGVIPNISGKGEKAQEMLKILKIMQNSTADLGISKQPKIHQMLIFDRRIDTLTPLLTQITYESLLDFIFQIESGFIMLPNMLFGGSLSTDDGMVLNQLNSSDIFYGEIRNYVIHESLKKIYDYHREVEAQRDKYLKAQKLEEIVEVTSNLRAFKVREKCSQLHLTLGMNLNKFIKMNNHKDLVSIQNSFIGQVDVDKVHPYIEELLVKGKDIEEVVQLICIQSLCSNGLKPKVLNWYKKEIIRNYGIQYASVLFRLEKMGLLSCQQTGMINLSETPFEVVLRTLNLVPEAENMQLDVSNIYAGFIPTITRLVQHHSKPFGWTTISKAMNLLPGPEFHLKSSDLLDTNYDYGSESIDGKKVVLVVYVGGVTYSEISTLRFLSQQEDSNVSYLILTTGIIHVPNYLKQLTQPFEVGIRSQPSCPVQITDTKRSGNPFT